MFEDRVAALEGGVAALAVASGAAAVTYAIENITGAGDHIVAAKTIYGGTFNLLSHTLKRFGVDTTFVDPDDLSSFEKAIKPNTKLIFIETLGNPNSNIVDVDAVASIAHKHGIPLVIDNTFATPFLFRPIEHGADIVVHSATKFLGGHGTTLGGVIVDSGKFNWKQNDKISSVVEARTKLSWHRICRCGRSRCLCHPYPCGHTSRYRRDAQSIQCILAAAAGVETLSLRVERHVQNALKVVDFLAHHPQVEKVYHPSLPTHPNYALYQKFFPNGAGSIFTFDIKGNADKAKAWIDHLKIFSLLANVADVKSLVIHPASTTHSQLNEEELESQGIHQNTIRLSIGTEHIDDIIADLQQAFDAVK